MTIRAFICDSNSLSARRVFVGDAANRAKVVVNKSFHARDSVRPSTSGMRGLNPSTVGHARKNDGGTQGMSSGKRAAKVSGPEGSFKANGKGAPGTTTTPAEIEAVKKAAFEQGVHDYHNRKVRDEHQAALKKMEDWVQDRINAHPWDSSDIQAALGGT